MSFLRNLFGKSEPEPRKQTKWVELGSIIDGFELQNLHPDHHNYPAWKGGERWLKLLKTNWGTQIVFTQGLAHPAQNDGYELYLESSEKIEDFSSSWQANLIYEMGRVIPNVHDLSSRLHKNKFLSVQINIDGAPEEWSLANPNGNIGILIGLSNEHLINFQPPHFTPLNVKLLRPAEMLHIIKNGEQGRNNIANLLGQQGNFSLSYLERNAVV